ncbi:MAG: O-antigen ligase family protein [Anaerolineales bacterium]|nr:O-antigen ligase family protein [Anaerolineales bacterium]
MIFLVVYATFAGGDVEVHPRVKIIHQVGSALLIATWLVSLRHRSFPVTRLNGPLWALTAGWLLAALLGENLRVSFEFVWMTFVHVVLFLVFVDLVRSGHQRWLMEALFVVGGVIILLGAAEMIVWYFGIPRLLPQFAQGWPEIGGYTLPPSLNELSLPLAHNNPTGAYAVVLIPLSLAWGNTTPQSDLRWGLRALTGGLIGVVLLTQSRGAYLALVALAGFMTVIWLLRADVRARFPRRLQMLLRPRTLLAAAAVGGGIAVLVLYQIIINPSRPNPNDVTRMDLWYSAVRMFQDQPWLGVGPYLFKGIRLYYGNWPGSYSYISLNHAHNLFFNVIAEGGIVLLTLSTALLVRFGRVWRSAWASAPPSTRRRLEAGLAALLAFSVHNMVDAFLQTQLMIPMLIILAYTAAHDPQSKDQVRAAHSYVRRARLEYVGTAVVLVACQIAFLPIHQGALKQFRFMALNGQEHYAEALETVRQAREADPWLDLYQLEEATVLGRLAYDDPETYLAEAISAFETSVTLMPAWDLGWHNLAALYAQAGRYQQAVEAEQEASARDPLIRDYRFKLGEYLVLAGDLDAGRDSLLKALADRPWLIASSFWGNHEQLANFPQEALEHFKGTATEIDLLLYSGDFEQLAELAASAEEGTLSLAIRRKLAILWPAGADTPCIYCYHAHINSDLLEAERLLHAGAPDAATAEAAEKMARRALFLRGAQDYWGWYILARLEEARGAGHSDSYLVRAVRIPADYRHAFAAFYRMEGTLDVLPQARVPVMSPIAYEPWLRLAAREEERGNWDNAASIRKVILRADPYAELAEPWHIAGGAP